MRKLLQGPKVTEHGLMEKVCAMLDGMGSTAWAAFPAGTTLEIKEPSHGGTDNPQVTLLDRADRQCDILVLGQTLTTDVADSGSRALGDVHASVRDEIVMAAAEWAARIVQQQIVRPICQLNWQEDDQAPEIEVAPHKQEDEKANAERDAILINAGIEFPKAYLYEKHHIPLPKPGEEVIGRPPPAAFPQLPGAPGADDEDDLEDAAPSQARAATVDPAAAVDEIVRSAVAKSVGARRKWLEPLNDEIRRLAAVASDPKLRDEDVLRLVEAGKKRLPELFGEMDQQSIADSLIGALGAAARAGANLRL